MSAASDQLRESSSQLKQFLNHFAMGTESLVVEVRALKIPNGTFPPKTLCGFFDLAQPVELWKEVKSILSWPASGQPQGVYVTINPMKGDLLARANNRLKQESKGEKVSGTDGDIAHRRRLVIDVDPVRIAGVCATDAEKAAAKLVSDNVLADLAARGFPEPMLVDSGNGFQAWHAIDLPADDGGLVENFLKALNRQHGTEAAKVDTSVFNPSRIMRLPGTWNRKGDSIPLRPHRLCRILSAPDPRPVTREQLEAVVAAYPEESDQKSETPSAAATTPAKLSSAIKSPLFSPADLCQRYLSKVPGAVEGQDGSDDTFKVCRIIWNDFGLDEAEGWPLLVEWNAKCSPPWELEVGNQSLRRKWNEAVSKGPCEKGRGWKLQEGKDRTEENKPKHGFPKPRLGENWNDPHRLARLFADLYRYGNTSALIQWRDEFHEWGGAAWLPMPESDLEAKIARHCREVFVADMPHRIEEAKNAAAGKPPSIYAVTSAVKSNVRLNLAGQLNHPDTGIDAPFWLPGAEAAHPAEDVIAAPNGLFTLTGIAEGRGAFESPTPLYFTPNAITFSVPSMAKEPTTWLRCCSEWFNDDSASIDGLQEWLGYLLSGRTEAHKLLFLVGPPRSGKGTIIRVLVNLIGAVNVASTTFTALGENFGLENLVGKRVALIPDARLGGRSDSAAIVERLLSISGEDPQSVNRKNRSRITIRLKSRFVLASNEIPRLPDSSGALASRFHILHTPNSWIGREDTDLGEKLAAELAGILHWAAAGWVRFQKQGFRFTPNDAAKQYHRELADLSSPVRAFVRQCCLLGPEHETEIPLLYAAWVRWNEQRKREVGPEGIFGRDMRAAFPHLRVVHRRSALGNRVRSYAGIGLKADADWGEADEVERDGTRSVSTYAKQKSEMTDIEYVSPDRVPSRSTDDWLTSTLSTPQSVDSVRSAAAAAALRWDAVVEAASRLAEEVGGLDDLKWKLRQ